MKARVIAVLGAVTLLAGLPGAAAGGAPRSETQPYNYVEAGTWGSHARFGSAVFETEEHERFVTIEIDDAVSDTVFFRVHQNLDNDPWWEAEREYCGTKTDRIPIKGGYYVYVHFVGSVPPICDGRLHLETTGTVKATFTG